jgi:hypothetical protein
MKLSELIAAAGFEVVAQGDARCEVTAGYTSDLLSDVMAHCPEGSIFITVQNHKNSVAVSTLVGAVAILVVHDREIPKDMLDAAQAENVALLRTSKNQFEASCLVAKILSVS